MIAQDESNGPERARQSGGTMQELRGGIVWLLIRNWL